MTSGLSHPVTENDLTTLKQWFGKYVHSFYSTDPIVQQAVKLKEDHSLRVCTEILGIGRKLALSVEDLRLAEVMALFHDIGRFEQVTRYQTFVDGKSENHALLGVKVLLEENTLSLLNEETRELILKAISYHNRMAVPEDEHPVCIYFSNLLRDADKLDIFNVFADYYCAPHQERNSAVELDLPDTPVISDDVLDGLQNGRMVKMQQLRSLNDFKILQMAWIYDINFRPTFQTIRERNYIGLIRNSMPPSEKIDRIVEQLSANLQKYTEACISKPSPAP